MNFPTYNRMRIAKTKETRKRARPRTGRKYTRRSTPPFSPMFMMGGAPISSLELKVGDTIKRSDGIEGKITEDKGTYFLVKFGNIAADETVNKNADGYQKVEATTAVAGTGGTGGTGGPVAGTVGTTAGEGAAGDGVNAAAGKGATGEREAGKPAGPVAGTAGTTAGEGATGGPGGPGDGAKKATGEGAKAAGTAATTGTAESLFDLLTKYSSESEEEKKPIKSEFQKRAETENVGIYNKDGVSLLVAAMYTDSDLAKAVFNRLKVSNSMREIVLTGDVKKPLKDNFTYDAIRTILLSKYINSNDDDKSKYVDVFNAFGLGYSKIFTEIFLKNMDIYLLVDTYEAKINAINGLFHGLVKSVETGEPTIAIILNEHTIQLWGDSINLLNEEYMYKVNREEDRLTIAQNELGILLYIKLLIINQNKVRGELSSTEKPITMPLKRKKTVRVVAPGGEQQGGSEEDLEF
jgi:hypothetical protein